MAKNKLQNVALAALVLLMGGASDSYAECVNLSEEDKADCTKVHSDDSYNSRDEQYCAHAYKDKEELISGHCFKWDPDYKNPIDGERGTCVPQCSGDMKRSSRHGISKR